MDDKIIHTLRKRFPTAKIMPDLLVEAQHSTVRIFEVMKAITEKKDMPKIMSLKIGSPGVLAVTILTRRISPLVKWRTGVCNVTGGTEKLPQLSI